VNEKQTKTTFQLFRKNKRCQHIPITRHDKVIPHSNTVKKLGMTLDAKLHWKVHVKKREKLELK